MCSACLSDGLAKPAPPAISAIGAIDLLVVEFERVLQIVFDALDEFPSDVPWAAQYVLEWHINALFLIFSFVLGLKLQ